MKYFIKDTYTKISKNMTEKTIEKNEISKIFRILRFSVVFLFKQNIKTY